jgi:ribosomal protein S27AE
LATPADVQLVETFRVECLSCGARRIVVGAEHCHVDVGECNRCGYVGWALWDELTQAGRRQLRERPVERRRLRTV